MLRINVLHYCIVHFKGYELIQIALSSYGDSSKAVDNFREVLHVLQLSLGCVNLQNNYNHFALMVDFIVTLSWNGDCHPLPASSQAF